ncbi:DoxX family protein [Thioalkalivibrio sp. XN279]|uniref:DoxX family protein n=1 Tax=Thioalkalivibrio sp. XN279 TaxID=2714953 RepID=UPI0014075093|nr:DoxX family protein [Thioalkalivibrio sp. XN279]NHA13751.1 DoxX family protein [Thioalkalivibrio sp. XN279]
MTKLQPWADLAARVALAALFIIAGLGKIGGYEGTAGYMQSMGVPGVLLPLVIALEIVGGLAIAVGYRTRLVAFLLAGFSVLSGLIFHSPLDPNEQTQFLKNLAIGGGFLLLVVHGAGRYSLDARRR